MSILFPLPLHYITFFLCLPFFHFLHILCVCVCNTCLTGLHYHFNMCLSKRASIAVQMHRRIPFGILCQVHCKHPKLVTQRVQPLPPGGGVPIGHPSRKGCLSVFCIFTWFCGPKICFHKSGSPQASPPLKGWVCAGPPV